MYVADVHGPRRCTSIEPVSAGTAGNLKPSLEAAARLYQPGGKTCLFGFDRGPHPSGNCTGFKFQRDLNYDGPVMENPIWFCAA